MTEFRRTIDESDLVTLDDLPSKAQELETAIQHSGHDLPYQVALMADDRGV
jgi:hypothetical protein